MASKIEFVEFVVDQLRDAGTITYRKMFGEYGLYCDGKIFAVICDDQFYIKITDAGREICPALEEAPPYAGAKNYFRVDDVENREMMTKLTAATCAQLPAPKPKKSKKKGERMAFDFKKEYKEFYLPKNKPELITVPPMHFIAVRGKGDPNEEGGAYKQAIGLLYGIAFTIKMSKNGDHRMEGYFDFVVPPLEGLWWQEGVEGVDYSRKADFEWISMIRLPEFVTQDEFNWAIAEASAKKKSDFSKVEFLCYDEGLCVQCMHIGPYDDEPATVEAMNAFAAAEGIAADFGGGRRHHEIYLSDARKCRPESLKTVIRHPVKY